MLTSHQLHVLVSALPHHELRRVALVHHDTRRALSGFG